MDKKKFYLSKIISIIILLCMLSFSLILADDTTGNTYYDTGNVDRVASHVDGDDWGIHDGGGENYTGTVYTISYGGKEYTLALPAGTTIPGSDNIKGYQSSGMSNLDTNGAEFNLPNNGILELQRSDWAAVARQQGNEELAKAIESGASFKGYAEQYLSIKIPGQGYVKMTASAAKSLLEKFDAQNGGQILYDGIGFIRIPIEASYNSFREKDQEYLEKQLIMQALGLKDEMKGWAGYEYGTEEIKKEEEKTPDPEPEVEPNPEPTPDPEPEPELPPKSNRYDVEEGLAPENTSYTANVKIDNEKFGVYNGNPIPTDEELTLTGCTTLLGAVENLGKNKVTFKPWTYTVYASWSREEERTGERQKTVNGKLQYDKDGEPIMEEYTYTETVSGVESATTAQLSGSTEYYKIRSYTNWGVTKILTVTNESFGSHTFTAPKQISYYAEIIPDTERITENTICLTGYKNAKEAQKAAKTYASSASVLDFWTVKTDILYSDIGVITYNGAVSDASCNILETGKETTLQVKNNSVGTSGYASSGTHTVEFIRLGGSKTGWAFTPNSVRIHTPIHNTLTITSPSNNQLVDVTLANGNKIVTLDEEFTATVELNGNSYYYTSITTALEKYVKAVYIECGVCGKKIAGTTHTCKVPLTRDDNKTYEIKATVIAKNVWEGAKTAEAQINNPDEIYSIVQKDGVYIAGKIYDLEVRTVDDPAWKLKEAEKLSKLPTGEYKDNAITSYKYGVKLGYRAYFDLKTLGTATQGINITPKIYYVTKDGEIRDDITIYYRVSKTEYKKLKDTDLLINMQMVSTKGDVNNSEYKREILLTKISPKYSDINYTKQINIGGLNKLTLTRKNTTITKYNGKEYTGLLGEVSRRWYGEIYLPASTIVSDNKINKETMKESAIITNISKGKGVIKEGYLLITFENIETIAENVEQYLNYAILRDADGTQISPETPSVLVQEKENKTTITLPNGIEIKNISENFINTNAPIIIYDVSLRANDDYESTGTH